MGTNRSPRRRLITAVAITAVTVGTWGVSAPGASAAAAAVGPLQLSATSGPAGTAINVGGTGCVPILGIGSVTGLVVKSGLSITTFSATPNAQGAWSSPVVVPTGSTPGVYVISAICVGLGLPYVGVSYTVTAPPTTTAAAPATTAAPGPLPTIAVTIPTPVLTVPTTAPRATTTAPRATTTTVKPGVVAGTPTTAVDTDDDETTDPNGGNQKTNGDDGNDGSDGSNGTGGLGGSGGTGSAGATGASGATESAGASGSEASGSDGSALASASGDGVPGAELASREVAADGTALASGPTSSTGRLADDGGISSWVWILSGLASVGIIGGGLWYARFRNVQVAGWWKQWMGEHTTQWSKRGRK